MHKLAVIFAEQTLKRARANNKATAHTQIHTHKQKVIVY